MIHEIFVTSEQFEEIISGERTFISSQDYDRPFTIGDILALNEIEDEDDFNTTTGRSCAVHITSIDRNVPWVNVNDWALMSIKPCHVIKSKRPIDIHTFDPDYRVPLATDRRKDGTE